MAQEELAGIPRIRRDSGANLSLKPEIDEDLRLEPEVIEDKDVPLRPPLHLPDWPRDVPPRDPYYDDPIHRAVSQKKYFIIIDFVFEFLNIFLNIKLGIYLHHQK